MIFGLQIGGWFLAITAVMVFTVWAEAWLKSTATLKRVPVDRMSASAEVVEEVDVSSSARGWPRLP
ncbi:MAG TPA: hypothetical protein VM841_05295 [Actinomycetota bacterium]|nr:hypothetical protein [Actinomycetota bacterium]